MVSEFPKYKYQYLFDDNGIASTCPAGDLVGDNLQSFRWSLDPISHELNFLPNILYNQRKPQLAPRRINDSKDMKKICGECGVSFFISLKKAKDLFFSFGEPARKNLGYTHVAEGQITQENGVRTQISGTGHFNFYEYESADFGTTFLIVDVLSN